MFTLDYTRGSEDAIDPAVPRPLCIWGAKRIRLLTPHEVYYQTQTHFFFFSFKIYNLKVCFRCWLVSITIKKEAEEEERWKKESSNLLLPIVVKIMMSVVSLGIWGSGCYRVASNNVSWWFCYVLCVSYIYKKKNQSLEDIFCCIEWRHDDSSISVWKGNWKRLVIHSRITTMIVISSKLMFWFLRLLL